MKIVFATGNPHKLQELKAIAGDCGIEFILPPEGFDPVEDGKTFEENSLIKAREAAKLSGLLSLADDSGLCVEALGGAPGIYSARYAQTPQKRIEKLLKELNEILRLKRHFECSKESQILQPQNEEIERKAKFVCAMSLVKPNGEILFQTIGECHGYIAEKQAGTNGFGYDPIFVPLLTRSKGAIKTMAELSEDEKNQISHRGIALRKVLEFLKNK